MLTRDQIIRFDKGNFTETLDNPYGLIPVVEYLMNRQRLGLYENVTGLIEAYNRAIGEKANDVDAFAEAYMKLIGVDIDDEEVKRIRENRIINLPVYGDTTGTQVDFMAKPTADSTQENLLDRLDRQIYQISMVANISDESFGNATSGTALAYKLQAMSNLASGFDRKIEKACASATRSGQRLKRT
ncbi:phage portal protein [Allobaculum sp. Allo2]|nr:phage portal protein [Allobaculum sp. Allo2]